MERYYEHIERGRLLIARGIKFTTYDVRRRTMIQRLMGDFELSMKAIELNYLITFSTYFEKKLGKLQGLSRMGW